MSAASDARALAAGLAALRLDEARVAERAARRWVAADISDAGRHGEYLAARRRVADLARRA